MALRYRLIAKAAQTELVVRRSRFISFIEPVGTETDVAQALERIRKLHPTATHHCYAYQLKEPQQLQKCSDDGEPSGTAGRPILDVIQHHGLFHTLIVVVRYFGGVMLGAGGLIRAYGDSAAEAIAVSDVLERRTHRALEIEVDYSTYGKLEFALRNEGVLIGDVEFGAAVTFICWPEVEAVEELRKSIIDWTNNRAKINHNGLKILDHQCK